MKKFKFFIMAALMAGFIGGMSSPAEANQGRQLKRIYNGIRQGSITRHEFRELTKEQHRIHTFRQKAQADGHFSRRERRKLNRMIDKADRHIHRAKHNRKSCKRSASYGYRR